MKKFSSILVVLLLMLASFTAGMEYPRGDVSQDGQVNIKDVTVLIDYLLNGTWPDEPVTPPDNHEWVDLGLPSGTLWATCNVGANAPEEYGDYFAWGETEPKDYYDWNTYKWCNFSNVTSSNDRMTKYCTDSNYGYNGFTDGKTELDPEDDAAYVNWGLSWCMPTKEQQDELREICTSEWTQINGVNGCMFTGPNGNTLFLPAEGYIWRESLGDVGSVGRYLSRTLFSWYQDSAYILYFNSGGDIMTTADSRRIGFTVRPVRVSQN